MIQIGKTYMDKWGRKHSILGYVRLERGSFGRPDVVDKERVASNSNHFYTKSGLCTTGGVALVMLSPKRELAYWKRRIEEIEAVNSTDKLKLVENELNNMRERIKEL